jgi:hypothetical protein
MCDIIEVCGWNSKGGSYLKGFTSQNPIIEDYLLQKGKEINRRYNRSVCLSHKEIRRARSTCSLLRPIHGPEVEMGRSYKAATNVTLKWLVRIPAAYSTGLWSKSHLRDQLH